MKRIAYKTFRGGDTSSPPVRDRPQFSASVFSVIWDRSWIAQARDKRNRPYRALVVETPPRLVRLKKHEGDSGGDDHLIRKGGN